MAFQFRFQKILDVKEKQQQAAEIELARLDNLLLEKQAVLERWVRARRETLEDRRQARLKGELELDARYGDYLAYVATRMQQCQAELVELRRQREEARLRLEQLLRACQILQNYRDRLHREFIVESERSEEKILDLHAIHKYIQVEGAL